MKKRSKRGACHDVMLATQALIDTAFPSTSIFESQGTI